MDLSSGALWAAFGAIVLANVLLSGDNAIVIAMAARSLPAEQRRRAIFWGSAVAIVLRIVLTLAAVQLLQLAYLKVAGALVLLWIGVKLLADPEEVDETRARATTSAAVRTILVADLAMSVDNVIAVAAAADSAPQRYRVTLLIIGLATSIPLIVAGSGLLLKVLDRLPLATTACAALLGYLAGRMLVTDPALSAWFDGRHEAAPLAGAGAAFLVVVAGQWLRRRRRRKKAP